VRYLFIQEYKQEYKEEFPTSALCRVMEVTPSGFYAWRNAPPSKRQEQDALLLAQIQDIHQASRQSYGSPRIYQELREQGVVCGRHRVARLMRVHQIWARQKRRYQVTTQSKHDLAVSENVLERQFTAQAPNRRWAGDITYLWTTEGWLYLAVVLDLFSRRIIGWSMQGTLETRLVQDALSMALQARNPEPGLLHHSDRGSQYASHSYQEQLRQHGMVGSMSRRGNCWDNAVVESFFSTLKSELIRDQPYRTRAQARSAVFEYIEVWYNRKRRHSTLGYVSPEQFERQYNDREPEGLIRPA
jgi:transposase InsO family protein